jgi:hypothetical protein
LGNLVHWEAVVETVGHKPVSMGRQLVVVTVTTLVLRL